MKLRESTERVPKQPLALTLVALAVGLNGLLLILSTLARELIIRGTLHLHHGPTRPLFALSLLSGLTLIYVSALLRRRKRTAWILTMGVYVVVLLTSVAQSLTALHDSVRPDPTLLHTGWNVLLPAVIVGVLLMYQRAFTVRSDIRSFAVSLRIILLVLLITFFYGVLGFLLLDNRDFHEEITVPDAIHRTIDQFDLTTNTQLTPHTRRAQAFQTSLSVISIGAVAYALLSLFQPLRVRFITDQAAARKHADELLRKYPASSEDFFKLWPHDKMYFFDESGQAGVAYAVHRGVALVVGDPFGEPKKFDALFRDFDDLCRTNDWQIAFVHTEPHYSDLYKKHGFALQQIGEEAVLDIGHFAEHVAGNKYFRNIRNKLQKQHYTAEVLQPPLSKANLARLRDISRQWLSRPGRAERRFMMGYFNGSYMQQAPVMVLRDAKGTIQAFMNQVPSFDPKEANFDLLRATQQAPGNSNDFVLMNFVEYVQEQGFLRLNLGLCPLAGLHKHKADRSVIDNALQFVYSNGDRFYSFSGLYRFKAKYEPEWSARYIAYRGGVRGFTRAVNALNRAMHVKRIKR
jgi:phosphatidylglycerol lysyltransferase